MCEKRQEKLRSVENLYTSKKSSRGSVQICTLLMITLYYSVQISYPLKIDSNLIVHFHVSQFSTYNFYKWCRAYKLFMNKLVNVCHTYGPTNPKRTVNI